MTFQLYGNMTADEAYERDLADENEDDDREWG